MNYSQQDIWMLQFTEFFVTRYNYTTVAVQQAKDEIWLVNPKQVLYPVIRLTKTDMDNEFFDQDRIRQIHRAILDMFKREGKRLDLHMSLNQDVQTQDDALKISVKPGWVPEPELLAMFPGLGSVCHTVDNPKEAYAQISKNIEKFQIETFKEARKQRKAKFNKIQPVTLAVGLICVFIYICSLLLTLVSDDTVAISILLGSYYKAFVVGMNEWFRLLTSGFVHVDFFHVTMNVIALYYLGNMCEQIYGHVKYACILLGSIIMGSVFVFVGDGNIVSLGISGGLYGCMAAMLVYFWSSGLLQQPMIRRQFLNMLTVNILISFMPGISFLGHLGGFIGGLFLSFVAVDNKKWKDIQKHFRIAFFALCIVLGVFIANTRQLNEVYYGTDLNVAEIANQLHLDFYGEHISKTMYEYYYK